MIEILRSTQAKKIADAAYLKEHPLVFEDDEDVQPEQAKQPKEIVAGKDVN